MQQFGNQALLENVFKAASHDRNVLQQLDENPAAYLLGVGMYIPRDTTRDFNELFRQQAGGIITAIKKQGSAFDLYSWPSWQCTLCTVGAWTVGALIVSAGAASLAGLTATSSSVVALISFTGYSSTAAIAFLKTLGTTVGAGIAAIVLKICSWINAC